MPFVIRPDGDTDLSSATIAAEAALPQTISGLAAGTYEVGRLTWAADPVVVTAAGSDVVFTDDVSDGAGTPMAITTSLETNAVWQRGKSVLTLAGTYDLSGDPTGIAWRVGSGVWRQLTTETIGSGNWSGTLDIPADYLAQGTLEVKPINGENVTAATHANVTVTDLMVVMGQSNADGYATNLQTYTKTTFDFISSSGTEAFHNTTTDPVGNSNGSHWPAFAEQLDAAGIPPAMLLPVTLDGSGFADGDWNENDTAYNQAVSRLNTRLAATGGCAVIHWVQGEADCNSTSAGAAWESAFQNMVNAMRNAVALIQGIPWIITMVGEKGGQPGIDNWRESAINVIANNSWAHHGPNLINEVYGDGTHYGYVQGEVDASAAEAQLDRIGAMTMRATNGVLYGGGNTAPATISSISVDDEHTITVTFDRAMQNHYDKTGWAVRDDVSGALTVASTSEGATATEVVLSIFENLSGTVTVSYGEAEEASGGTLTDTDALAPLPPTYTYRTAAGTAPFAAGAFRPDDQAATTQWWSAMAGVTEDPAGTVSTWTNQIGTGATLSRGGGATFGAGTGTRTLNSLNVLDFDGANDRLFTTALTELPEFSIRANNAAAFYGLLENYGDFTDAAASSAARHGPGLWEVEFDATANTATLRLDGTQIAQATDYTGTENGHVFMVVNIDGSGNANDAIMTNWSSGDGFALMKHGGSQCAEGGVGEVVVCNDVLTGSDLTDMRGYLNNTWGL